MPSETTVHVAIELSLSSWLIATRLPGAEKPRVRRIEGGRHDWAIGTLGGPPPAGIDQAGRQR
jgi:hypothetical protein